MAPIDDVEGHVWRLLDSIFDEEPDAKIIRGARRFFAREFGVDECNVEAGIGPDRVLYVSASQIVRGYVEAVEVPIRFV